MKYVPYLYSMDGELSALKHQNFSQKICPLINIVKDKKTQKTSKSVLDEIEKIIKLKSKNEFFVNIPMNLDLTKKKIKNPISKFYEAIESDSNYQLSILNRFSKLCNVTPVIDVNVDNYNYGNLKELKSGINGTSFAYIFYAKKSRPLLEEISTLITPNDILIYYLDTYDFYKNSIKDDLKRINDLKKDINFKSLVIKQIYNDLTFFKLPNGEITPNDIGYDCIDSDFYNDFSSFKFDYIGDHCGIRNSPIYQGGLSYPAFIAINKSTFSHFGFKGLEKDINSYVSTLLPNILKSEYWNNILSDNHKQSCHGCSQIQHFESLRIARNESNPINNATTWKEIVISHYISIIDYKIKHNLFDQQLL